APGPRKARDKTLAHWIGDANEYNRNGAGCLPYRGYRWCGGGHEDVRAKCDQLISKCLLLSHVTSMRAIRDVDVATRHPTQCRSASLSARPESKPMRRTRSGCCALAASGHAVAAPPITFMKSRRRIAIPARKPLCSAFNFHHQNRKLPAAKRGFMPNVHCRNPEQRMSQMGRYCRKRILAESASNIDSRSRPHQQS